MSFTETKSIDRIEIVDIWLLQVREATTIMRGDEVISKTYHRWSFTPGSDLSEMPENVKAVAQAAWTPDVVEKYKQFIAEQEALVAQRTGGQA